jgi:hypothetical protein
MLIKKYAARRVQSVIVPSPVNKPPAGKTGKFRQG